MGALSLKCLWMVHSREQGTFWCEAWTEGSSEGRRKEGKGLLDVRQINGMAKFTTVNSEVDNPLKTFAYHADSHTTRLGRS